MTASRAVETALRSGNGTLHVPFPSSQVVKATPWLCQESACSPPREEPREWRVRSTTPPSYLRQATVSRGRNRASVRECPEQWGIPKFAGGQSHTSSRQGGLVCGALRLPHDLIRLPLLFPQNSLREFFGNPEKQESTCSPLTQGRLK